MKIKKIAFYFLVTNKKYCGVVYNEGIAVLIAMAKKKGVETSLELLDLADFKKGISIDQHADIYAVGFSSLQFPLARRVLRHIEENKKQGAIIVGGIHATVDPQSVFSLPEVDLTVSGEGEPFMQWLLNNPDCSLEECTIPNVNIKGQPFRPVQKCNHVDLSTLPFPDRLAFHNESLRKAPEFIFSRGCPFSCSYCANEFLNKNFGNKIRRKSPEFAIAELEDAFKLLDIAPTKILTFHDDVFLLDMGWLEQFSKLYKKTFSNPFRCNTTATAVTNDKIRLLKEMNCEEVWVGIESGDELFRKEVLKKNVSNEQIIFAFETLSKNNIKGVSFNLLGCPGETLEHIKATMELNRRCRVFFASCALFIPFPGTSLYEQEKAKNNLKELSEKEFDFGVSISGLKNKSISDASYNMYGKLVGLYAKEQWFQYYTIILLYRLKILPFMLPVFRSIKYRLKKWLSKKFGFGSADGIDFDRSL